MAAEYSCPVVPGLSVALRMLGTREAAERWHQTVENSPPAPRLSRAASHCFLGRKCLSAAVGGC